MVNYVADNNAGSRSLDRNIGVVAQTSEVGIDGIVVFLDEIHP